ncbi:MAG: ABC transporter permease [Oscillospiraceae bacterium]|nr:ABC transporter permease [Oscillospiraceae bacterium]
MINKIENHIAVKYAGAMSAIGEGFSNGVPVGTVGTVDDDMIKIGRLKLLAGSWPTAEKEIAVEEAYLLRMGLSLDLGQTIALEVHVCDEETDDIIIDEYELVGIVRNYSANWNNGLLSLVNIFVEWDKETKSTTYYCELYPKYEKAIDDIKNLSTTDPSISVLSNDRTYLSYEAKEESLSDYVVRSTIALIEVFAGAVVVEIDLRNRRQEILVLRRIGMTKTYLLRTYFLELSTVLILSVVIGNLAFVLLVSLIYGVCYGLGVGKTVFYPTLNVRHYILASALFLAGSVVVILFSALRLSEITKKTNTFHEAKRSMKRLRSKKYRSILVKLVYIRRRTTSLIIVSALIFCIAFITGVRVLDTVHELKVSLDYYPYDYSFGLLGTTPYYEIGEEKIDGIRSAYGVKDILVFSDHGYRNALFMQQDDKAYRDMIKRIHSYEWAEELNSNSDDSFVSVVGVSSNAWEEYENVLGIKAPSSGEAILYLPDLVENERGVLLCDDLGTIDGSLNRIRNHSVNVGDKISVMGDYGEIAYFTVKYIIYSQLDLAPSWRFYYPYVLMCNSVDLKDSFEERFTYVAVYSDPKAIGYQTDVELSRFSDLGMSNHRLERKNMISDLVSQIVITAIIMVLMVLLLFFLWMGAEDANGRKTKQINTILWQEGMEKERLLLLDFLSSFIDLMKALMTGCLSASLVLILRGMYLFDYLGLSSITKQNRLLWAISTIDFGEIIVLLVLKVVFVLCFAYFIARYINSIEE